MSRESEIYEIKKNIAEKIKDAYPQSLWYEYNHRFCIMVDEETGSVWTDKDFDYEDLDYEDLDYEIKEEVFDTIRDALETNFEQSLGVPIEGSDKWDYYYRECYEDIEDLQQRINDEAEYVYDLMHSEENL